MGFGNNIMPINYNTHPLSFESSIVAVRVTDIILDKKYKRNLQ